MLQFGLRSFKSTWSKTLFRKSSNNLKSCSILKYISLNICLLKFCCIQIPMIITSLTIITNTPLVLFPFDHQPLHSLILVLTNNLAQIFLRRCRCQPPLPPRSPPRSSSTANPPSPSPPPPSSGGSSTRWRRWSGRWTPSWRSRRTATWSPLRISGWILVGSVYGFLGWGGCLFYMVGEV